MLSLDFPTCWFYKGFKCGVELSKTKLRCWAILRRYAIYEKHMAWVWPMALLGLSLSDHLIYFVLIERQLFQTQNLSTGWSGWIECLDPGKELEFYAPVFLHMLYFLTVFFCEQDAQCPKPIDQIFHSCGKNRNTFSFSKTHFSPACTCEAKC